MHPYIIINHTQHIIETALIIDNASLEYSTDDKRHASRTLVPHLDALLTKHTLNLTDLSFIGINQGPGLFSTLRSIISTVNGIHCATGIPLIGIDGLIATAQESYNTHYPLSVTLLNAFNNEVYYAISDNNNIIKTGYNAITTLLQELQDRYSDNVIAFNGNGTALYRALILEYMKNNAFIPDHITDNCSLSTIQALAAQLYKQNSTTHYLFPLYLKKHPVEMREHTLGTILTQ
jgi:tRNA threonylcarbamoyl adenosine modification protein YeaZ